MKSILIDSIGEIIAETNRDDPQNAFIQFLTDGMAITKLTNGVWQLAEMVEREELPIIDI